MSAGNRIETLISKGPQAKENADGSFTLSSGAVTPTVEDRRTQDEGTGSFLKSLPRHKRLVFATVLAGMSIGTLAGLAGADSAEASDERTQHTFEPQNQSVKTIDNFDGFDGPLGNPYQDLDFGNHQDMHELVARANHNLDNLDEAEGLADQVTHASESNGWKVGDKISITIGEGSSVDGEIQEKFGLTPDESWDKTNELIDGDSEGYHFVQEGDQFTFEADEGDVNVLNSAGIENPDADGAGTQTSEGSASAHFDPRLDKAMNLDNDLSTSAASGNLGSGINAEGFALTSVSEETPSPSPSIDDLGGIPDEGTPTPTPTPTAAPDIEDVGGIGDDESTATVPASNSPEPPTPHPTETAQPSASPSNSPEPSSTHGTPTEAPTPSPSPTPTPTPTEAPTPSYSPEPSSTHTAEPTPSPTASPTPTPTPSPSPTPTPTLSPTPSYSPEPSSTHTAEPTPSPTASSTPTPTQPPLEEFQLIVKKRLDANRNGIFDKDDIPLDQRVQVWIDEDRDMILDGEEGVMSFNLGTDGVEAVTFSMTQDPEGLQVCAEEPLDSIDPDLEPVDAKGCDVVDESRITEVRLLNKNKEIEVTPTPTPSPSPTPTPVPSETPLRTPVILPPTGGNPDLGLSTKNVLGAIVTMVLGSALLGTGSGLIARFRRTEEDEEEESASQIRNRRVKTLKNGS